MENSQFEPGLLGFHDIVNHLRLADVYDILICALLIYAALTWLRERASFSVAVAFLTAGGVYIAARHFEMYLTLQLFRIGLPVLLVVLVVVFQDDLRRAVERLFGWRSWTNRSGSFASEVIDILVEAIEHMSEKGVGALIVLRGRESLECHCRGGILLDARISEPLLQSIFNTRSPGHDGAIFVSRDRIERFAVHLPLSSNLALIGQAGTRHAAGLGLSELCDAMVIIVSEERGTISVAHERMLFELEGAAELRKLITEFREPEEVRKRERPFRWAVRRLGLKLASLAVAAALWISWVYRIDNYQQSFDSIPVLIRNLPQGWEVGSVEPDRVRIRLLGPERAFDFLDKENLAVTLDVSNPVEGMHAVQITEQRLNLPADLSLRQSEPAQIKLRLDRVISTELPIRIQKLGSPPSGYGIRQIEVQPTVVKVMVPENQKDLLTEAIVVVDWKQIEFSSHPVRLKSKVVLPAGVRRQSNEPEAVDVIIHWESESTRAQS